MSDTKFGIYAIILVKVERTRNGNILTAFQELDEIGLIMGITGDAEFVLLVRASDNLALGKLIQETIQLIDGVKETLTYVVLSSFTPVNSRWPIYTAQRPDSYYMYSLMLVSVERLHIIRAFETMQQLDKVGLAFAVTGDADIALLVKTDNPEDLGNFVFEIIHDIKGVVDTRTHVGLTLFDPVYWPLFQ